MPPTPEQREPPEFLIAIDDLAEALAEGEDIVAELTMEMGIEAQGR